MSAHVTTINAIEETSNPPPTLSRDTYADPHSIHNSSFSSVTPGICHTPPKAPSLSLPSSPDIASTNPAALQNDIEPAFPHAVSTPPRSAAITPLFLSPSLPLALSAHRLLPWRHLLCRKPIGPQVVAVRVDPGGMPRRSSAIDLMRWQLLS